jgi:SET family sugar efflux transporter-like MFS transporter
MRSDRIRELRAVPFFVPLATAVMFIGLGDAVTGSYMTLFAADRAHLSPLALGSLLTVLALSSILVSTAFGHWFDRAPSRVPLFLALLMTTVGYALLALTTQYHLLLLIACLPLGMSAAAFPQLFAIAKGHLDHATVATTERGVAMLRALWSVAWAVGPALGAVAIAAWGFSGVFLTTASCGVVASVIVLLAGVRVPNRTSTSNAGLLSDRQSLRTVGLAASSFTLFHMAMFMGSIALPIVVTRDLGGTKSEVGLIFSVCALLEVLVLLRFVLHPSTQRYQRWLSRGFVCFLLYFLTIFFLPSIAVLFVAQALRAAGIGLVGYLGIGYIQSSMPDRVGSAAALFSNTVNAGSLLAGFAAGSWAQIFGYSSVFTACAGLSGLGWILFQVQLRLREYDDSNKK